MKWGPFVQGDIADQDLVRDVVKQYRIQAVMHFAAYASVAESMRRPRTYFKNNVASTFRMLEMLIDCSVKQIIFSSTCATYGIPNGAPISEEHQQNPVNPYGESKLMIERALRWYDNAYGLSSVSLRYFNAAGADPKGETGEVHDPETHLIPLAISAALGESPFINVYGGEYATHDGTAVRDYTHVSDLANAHVLALKYLLDGGPSTFLNLGTGRGHSVMDVVHTIEKVAGRRVPVRHCEPRPGDPPKLVADASKASKVLGWRPAFIELKDIVSTAWNWHSSSEHCFRPQTVLAAV